MLFNLEKLRFSGTIFLNILIKGRNHDGFRLQEISRS